MSIHSPQRGPLPLVIGITGHRDLPLDDIPTIRKAIASFFTDLMKDYPSTPLCLLSSLAEGADSLAAEVALEMNIKLMVALPFPQSVYEMDFETEASRQNFRKLLSAATQINEVPLAQGVTATSVAVYGADRNLQYLEAGRFVLLHSQILLALWDGVFNMKTGGTGEVVKLQLEGKTYSSLLAEDQHQLSTGAVCHVMTSRASTLVENMAMQPVRNSLLQCGELEWLYPASLETGGTLDEEQHRLWGCIDAFNKDCIQLPDKNMEASKAGLIADEELSLACLHVLQQFGWADGLAQHYQRKTIKAFRQIALYVPISVICFEVFSNAWTGLPVIAGYLIALVAAYAVFKWAERRHYHRKYLDYRALAEGLRVQFFWKMAGMNEPVAKYYLIRQESELDWIRHALRTLDFVGSIHSTVHPSSKLSVIKQSWVDAQTKYYERALLRDYHKLSSLQKKIKLLVQVGMWVVTPAMLIIHGFEWGGALLYQCIQVVMSSIFVVAGALSYYTEKMQYESHIKQYRRMSAIFKRYASLWEFLIADDENQQPARQNLLCELGKAALVENSDWVLTHRRQPLEVPQG